MLFSILDINGLSQFISLTNNSCKFNFEVEFLARTKFRFLFA